MIFYILQIGIITAFSAFFRGVEKYNYKLNYFYGAITFLYLFLVNGNRAITVGTDTMIYYRSFAVQSTLESNRFLFDKLSELVFYFFNGNYHVFLLIVSFITLTCVYCSIFVFFGRFDHLSILLYINLMFYYSSFNTFRQALAMSLVLLSVSLLLKKRLKMSVLFLFLAFGIHTTSLVALAIYPLYYLRIDKKWKYLLFAILEAILLLSTNFFVTKFINYFTHYQLYLSAGARFEYLSSTNILRIIIFTWIVLLGAIVLYKSEKTDISRSFHFLFFMSITSSILYIFFSGSLLYTRIAQYFSITSVLFVPYLVSYMSRVSIDRYIVLFAKSSILLLSYLLLFYSLNINSGEIIPYVFYKL